MTLRSYQQRLSDAAVDHMRTSIAPIVVEAATGAGKSHVIADIAHRIHFMTGKRILCLAPSAELVTQNRGKYLATGNPASLFSASAGGKDLRHPVVFGSPLTVKNRISRFQDGFALVVIDEAHGITPTVRGIITEMRRGNSNLRVFGLTATPYRLGTGYIFRQWPDGSVNDDTTARDPYFDKLVAQVGARELIDGGWLTRPILGEIGTEGYDTSGLQANSRGQFDAAAVDRAYHGHGRKTAAIVADVVARAQDRQGVMFFAATVKHAHEVMASLPPEMTALVTGETPRRERAAIIARFKAKALKYLVNVSVLTTGFDAPHVDVIAILRKTESVGLLQQIIGRGLRIAPGKDDVLILDYTTNMQDHCPDGDLFDPTIKAGKGGGEGGTVSALCPDCGYENSFTARPDTLEFTLDENGYCLDLDGNRIETGNGPMPGHFGRRCWGQVKVPPRGEYERCGYRWTGKECPECGAENDIAARYCVECKAEIVDPNEKLVGEFRAMKRDPTQRQTDRVLSMDVRPGVSQRGNKTLRVDFVTPWRSFSIWLLPDAGFSRAVHAFNDFKKACGDGPYYAMPYTVTYRKNAKSGFYEVLAYDRPEDVEPQTGLRLEAAE